MLRTEKEEQDLVDEYRCKSWMLHRAYVNMRETDYSQEFRDRAHEEARLINRELTMLQRKHPWLPERAEEEAWKGPPLV